MKYFEVIYNSSQHTSSGSVGFGIRTATESTPEEYLKILEELGVFSYDSGNAPALTPKQLFENPERIKEMPRGYLYARRAVAPGKNIYVLARKVAVGFDYTYYLSLQAGRLGNYVVHCFIFEEAPEKEVFGLLYENPAPESPFFLPANPVPSPDNEEMKLLSLGEQPPLPLKNKDFAVDTLDPISSEAIEILFAYIEAKSNSKPLLVRLDEKKTASVIADLYFLLPPSIASDITFMTNHQDEGIKKGYDIFFINEHYQFDVYKSLVFYLNLAENNVVNSKESEIFKKTIEKASQDSDSNKIHAIVEWLLSDGYPFVKDKSIQTNQIFYNYFRKDKELFYLDLIKESTEFKEVLSLYINKNPKNGAFLFELVKDLFLGSESIDDFKNAVETVRFLESAGINMEQVIDGVKAYFSEKMLETADLLAGYLKKIDNNQLKRYFDKSQFSEKKEYLNTKSLITYWPLLYSYFYTNPKTELKRIIEQTLEVGVSNEAQEKICNEIEPDTESRLKTYVSVVNDNPDCFKLLWPLIQKIAGKFDLSEYFVSQQKNPNFAPFFYFYVKNAPFKQQNVKLRLEYLKILHNTNEAFQIQLVKGFKQDQIYKQLFEDVKKQVVGKNYTELLTLIDNNVIQVLPKEKCDVSEWSMLVDLLKDNTANCTDKNIVEYWKLGKEVGDKKYLKKLVSLFVNLNKEEKYIQQFIEDVINFLKYDQEEILLIVEDSSVKKKLPYYRAIFKVAKTPIQEIVSNLERLKVKKEDQKALLERDFQDEYRSYKRGQSIKRFFFKIFPFFKKKENKK